MRYALYARYSSDNQSESSCEDQFRLCREAVAKDGGTIVREYSDHAISGASTLNRPEFQQMMLNAEAGNFDIIFAEDLSRLSRNFKDPAVLFEKLEYLGIKLITRTDGEITPLHIGLQGTMNALYLKWNHDITVSITGKDKGRFTQQVKDRLQNLGKIAGIGVRFTQNLGEHVDLDINLNNDNTSI